MVSSYQTRKRQDVWPAKSEPRFLPENGFLDGVKSENYIEALTNSVRVSSATLTPL